MAVAQDTTYPIGTVKVFGPFRWRKSDARHGECWSLVRPAYADHVNGWTFFYLKNYGGEPGDAFCGWKLSSGSPFDDAGAYETFEAAARATVPYLVKYFLCLAKEKEREAELLVRAVAKFRSHVEKTHGHL